MSEILLIAVVLILFTVSAFGIFLPFLPGVFFSWLAVFLYAFSSEFILISLPTILGLFCLFLMTVGIDFIAPIIGARKHKASSAGLIGTMLGFTFGFLTLGPIGIVIGPILGAFLGELINGRSHKESVSVAIGSFIGFLVGSLFKIIVIVVMFGFFITAAI